MSPLVRGELALVEWLKRHRTKRSPRIDIPMGDDMAALWLGGPQVLVTCDMLLDGVHFVVGQHAPEQIGRKAIACSLSDCAAMAVRPVAAVVSVALPESAAMEFAQALFDGAISIADQFDCPIVGGDTTSWPQPLAIDVAMLAEPWPDCEPVQRSGARPGDRILVTGVLGGSLTGTHLSFTPRVREAHQLASTLGPHLHAMMDISDGLALDLYRLCEASGCGAELCEDLLEPCISETARALSKRDGRSPLEHALHDGEDFELLLAVDVAADIPAFTRPVGTCTRAALTLLGMDGRPRALQPRGFEHFI